MRAQVIKWLHTDCMHSVQLPAKALHFSHNIHNDPGPYSASMDFCWIVRRQSESETPIYLCSSQVNDLWSFTLCRMYVDDMVLSQDNLSFIWHSEDRASWYILTIKANKMHNFSNLFGKVLYMFWTGPLSIIRSISTLYTRNRYCHASSVGVR